MVNEVYNRRIILNSFHAYSNGWKCGSSEAEFNILNTLCETNGGRAYPVQPSDFINVCI